MSPDPIQLAVYSPRVPNLTLVDLPGLTKIAIDGTLVIIIIITTTVRHYRLVFSLDFFNKVRRRVQSLSKIRVTNLNT